MDRLTTRLRRTALPAASGVALCAFVVTMAVGAVGAKPPERSSLDGRRLATFPAPTVSTVLDGTWMKGAESWLDDHVLERPRWLELHGRISAGPLRQPVLDDVYVGDPRDMQLSKPVPLTVSKQLRENAIRLSDDVRATGTPMLWVYVPRKEEVFDDRLPAAWGSLQASGAQLREAMAAAGPLLDLTSTLSDPAKRDSYYWRTDHHWTPAGQAVALEQLTRAAKDLGVTIPDDDRQLVDRDYGAFYGSTGRKVTRGGTQRADEFVVPQPDRWRARACRAGVCDRPTFVRSIAESPDPYTNRYAAFLGGDYGYQRMVNDDPAARGRILLLKDSFGNALSTYLAERVQTLVTIDERHYAGPEIRDLVARVKPDLVIAMHNQVTVLGNGAFDPTAWVDVAAAVERRNAAGDG